MLPTTKTNNTLVDSIVWAKPGGESDGACGPLIGKEGAPNAGLWWEKYVENLVVNANPPLAPTYETVDDGDEEEGNWWDW